MAEWYGKGRRRVAQLGEKIQKIPKKKAMMLSKLLHKHVRN
jgi:hypothetical protein